ncbi:MAG: hypothetical protein IT381_04450 [Deltaproteobacteria bacterium]|nr:hypothetical protein [Deltaproteobacteria bacterium]
MKTLTLLFLATAAIPAASCGKGPLTCTKHECKSLTPNPIMSGAVNICERPDGYVRLEDMAGTKLYECFCSVSSMKDSAAKICAEGAVCRKAGSACSISGDCCAGLHCTVNTCG